MTGSIKTKTPKYKFIIPQFNIATWHDYIEDNFRAIDALFYNIFDIQNFSGSWTKTTEYKKDQVLFIGEDYEVDETGQLKKDDQGELIVSEFSGRMVKVLKNHTTDNSDYFSLYYFNHKDEYELFADASTAQKFANLAKQYSENAQQSENNAELYKNNAQGYAQEAENSKNIAQQNAQLATNKAESAASSATIAKNSENSAVNSATLAEGYKNSAKSFADSAKSSKDITVENVQTVTSLVQDSNLVAVGTDLRSSSSNIKNVSNISEQTKNVSNNMSYIISVDNNKVNINKAVTNEANITTVATNIDNINITAQNKNNIDTVVNYKDAITTTSTNINAVNNVSENMVDVKKAVQSANDAKLWAIGTKTEKPEGSSKYWAEQAQQAAQVYDATETVKGIVRLATSDEVTTGTNNSVAITPLKLKQKIAQDLTNPSTNTVPSTKAVSDESSRITTLMNTKVSNCITEIPQDIKLELNNGTLTLKAGSKVYIPNGVGVFDIKNITRDLTTTETGNDKYILTIRSDGNLRKWQLMNCLSGSTAPTGVQYPLWYDTTNNLMKTSQNGGQTWSSGDSFPLCIFTVSSGVITSIDQVFNGFGYIGSTIYALPGVKGLIPNSRNADGSLKSIEFTLDKVSIYNCTMSSYFGIKFDGTEPILGIYGEQLYNSSSNTVIFKGVVYKWMYSGSLIYSNGRITSFTPKTAFHALDYNDKSTISGWSMPSSRYIDLTLGASGTTYTAPANGWFFVSKKSTAATQEFIFENKSAANFAASQESVTANRTIRVTISVKKGDNIYTYYTLGGSTDYFRFIYAEGENS